MRMIFDYMDHSHSGEITNKDFEKVFQRGLNNTDINLEMWHQVME